MTNNLARTVLTATGVSFTSSLSAFVLDSLADIAIWLVVMFSVIFVDLLMSLYKICKVNERKRANGETIKDTDRIRWSKGLRDTMGKMATYFAFVVAMVFVANASQIDNLHTWGCMAVIAGEGLSIVGNWCKAHGYNFNDIKLLNWGAKKVKLPEGIIEKEAQNKTKKK